MPVIRYTYPGMELSQLKCFVIIAETLSFTAAAKMLHVTQPALSYQISRLERELRTKLFDRSGRRVALTPEGELFLPLAQSVLFKADESLRIIRDYQGAELGTVSFGCNSSVAANLAPPVIAAFRSEQPHVRLELTEAGDAELQEGVRSGSLDFAIVTAPGFPRYLDITPLGSEDLLLVISPGHRLSYRKSVKLRELADETFVMASDTYNISAQIVEACRRAGFEPKVTCQGGSNETTRSLVRHNVGIAILPSIALRGLNTSGLRVIPLEDRLTRELNLIRAKDRSLTRAARALMDRLQTYVSEHLTHSPVRASATHQARL